MDTLPRISRKTIKRRIDGRSYERGEKYWRQGAVFHTRREGRMLKARCRGSRDEAYRVEITLGDRGVADAECSCPVGAGGFCKHVAAVLLTWAETPDEFVAVEGVEQSLARRSKEELIALIQQMLREEPELESLLELPLPAAGSQSAAAAPDAYRRQAEAAFRRAGDEWGAAAVVADRLGNLTEIGDAFLKQGNADAAQAVYQGVCAAVLDRLASFDDEEGDLYGVVGDCVEGLAACLRAAGDDAARREAIWRTFFDVYRMDAELGGTGLSDSTPDFVEDTTAAERRTIAGWVREAMRGAQGWGREALAGLLLDLEADTLDDEGYLRICRDTGRCLDLVDRLLTLGRVDEAAAEAGRAEDYDLLQMADLFVRHGQGDAAERLVRERSKTTQDVHMLEWLRHRAARRKDPAGVLELAVRIFRLRPSLRHYQDVRELARPAGGWERLRPKLLDALKKSDPGELIRVYLDDGEIDRALAAVQAKPVAGAWYGADLRLEVAEAAEKDWPHDAREIYRKQAEVCIAQRHRGGYQEACRYLKKVRDLYRRTGEGAEWDRYVVRLRERHRALRALHQELAKARL